MIPISEFNHGDYVVWSSKWKWVQFGKVLYVTQAGTIKVQLIHQITKELLDQTTLIRTGNVYKITQP